MKKLSRIFAVLSVLIFGAMCFRIGYNYCILMIGVNSAPAWTAFLLAFPYIPLVAGAGVLAYIFRRKEEAKRAEDIQKAAPPANNKAAEM